MTEPSPYRLMLREKSNSAPPSQFEPLYLITCITAGLICGGLLVIYAISLAALIFSGPLSAHIFTGIGLTLFTSVTVSIAIALMSSSPGMAIMPQDSPAVLLGVMASAIAAQMPASATSTELLYTVVIAIALTSILAGIFCFLLGAFKLGNVMRLIPYPVVGGFLAGTGWLLSYGAFSLMADIPLSLAQLPQLLQPEILIRWLSGVCFAILLLAISRRYNHVLLLPSMVLSASALFYVVLLSTNTSIVDARNYGLLLQAFPEQSMWQPLDPALLAHANWQLVFEQIGQTLTILLLTAMALLLNCTGIELATGQEIDLNRELRATGVANLVAGLGGGVVGFHALGLSTLSIAKMRANSRLVGLTAAAVCAVTLFAGSELVSLLPKPVLGGVALFLGLSFLVEWVYDALFKLPKIDYFVVILILLIIATVGFLQGVAIGLGVVVVLAVVHYSRTHVIHAASSSTLYSSGVYRPLHQKQLLGRKSDRVCIVELQGFLFFGNASKLLTQVRQQIQCPTRPRLEFVILDFRLVKALDSSAILSFIKLEHIAQQQGLTLVFTHLLPVIRYKLQLGGCFQSQQPSPPLFFATLEDGLAWCEDQILESYPWCQYCPLPLALQYDDWFCQNDHASVFADYLEEWDVEVGEFLFHEGDSANRLYLLESGQVDLLQKESKEIVRSLKRGDLIGEIEFYRQSPYLTSAVVRKPTHLRCLSRSAWQCLKQENPEVANAWQEFVIHQLSARLSLQADRKLNSCL